MPAMLANKVSEGKAAACPGRESCPYLPPSRLFAFLVSHGEFLGDRSLLCHSSPQGWRRWVGEAMILPPPPPTPSKSMLFISALLCTVGENYLLAYVETRVLHRYGAPGARGMLAPRHSFTLSYGDGVEGGKRRSLHQGCVITKHLVLNHPVWE